MSDIDIPAGARWQNDIAHELDKASFGIICVTPENMNKPWLMFEAGALSKSMKASRVCPLVYSLELSDLSGPVAQFQANILDRDGIYQVLKAINAAMLENGLDENQLADQFEMLWSRLDQTLKLIPTIKSPQQPIKESAIPNGNAEEILQFLHTVITKNNIENSASELSDPSKNQESSEADIVDVSISYAPISTLEGAIVGVSVIQNHEYNLQSLTKALYSDLLVWNRAGTNIPTVALSLTTEQLLSDDLLKIIGHIGKEFPKSVELELTEGQLSINNDKFKQVLSSLTEAGFYVGVKEFGTGYSSLSALKDLPINTIWIDKSFIEKILIDNNDRNIALAIASLGNSLNLVVIAEGVSTSEQSKVLLEIGVKVISGSMAGDVMSSADVSSIVSA
jgi:EAL domain-containing protein (putative c-di-GMP-specific phosphodiesterase class I)